MADTTKKQYEDLRKKYKLPKFDELEEFEIMSLEDTDFLLSDIREKIFDRLRNSTDFLADIIHPDTNITNMYESRTFDDNQKKDVFNVFKRLMFWRRNAFEVSIVNTDKANAEFISSFHAEWKDLKTKLTEIIGKVKHSWETESEKTEKLGYFG